MLSFYDKASIEGALSLPLEPGLRDLLTVRIAHSAAAGLIELTHLLVVQPGDTEADIIKEVSFSPLLNPMDGARYRSAGFQPYWDWLRDLGGWFELIVTVGAAALPLSC